MKQESIQNVDDYLLVCVLMKKRTACIKKYLISRLLGVVESMLSKLILKICLDRLYLLLLI